METSHDRPAKRWPALPHQAAAIALRRKDNELEVCLIRRRGSRHWGVPKGLVDPGETLEETALKEAWEEAGIKGRLIGTPLGTYEYDKWDTTLRVSVYVMEVTEQHAVWQEADLRERKWTSFDEAATLLLQHPVRAFLHRARRLATDALS
jgi:phosphohistidine phosphatase